MMDPLNIQYQDLTYNSQAFPTSPTVTMLSLNDLNDPQDSKQTAPTEGLEHKQKVLEEQSPSSKRRDRKVFKVQREIAGRRMAQWYHSHTFSSFYVLKLQLQACLASLSQYILNHVIVAPWVEFRPKLELFENMDLERFAQTHDEYVLRVEHDALLYKKISVAASSIRRLLALTFDVAHLQTHLLLPYSREPSARLRAAGVRQISTLKREFNQNLNFLLDIITKIADSGMYPNLEDLLMLLNYNRYYTEKSVSRQVLNMQGRV